MLSKILAANESAELLKILKQRFLKNYMRHPEIDWEEVEVKLKANPEKLWSVFQMEKTGGEPDIVNFNNGSKKIFFVDCSSESPAGRRSLCYDQMALEGRKNFKPKTSSQQMAMKMKVKLLNEDEYMELQKYGHFDVKTSSWLETPQSIRDQGGAIFGDHRFGRTFIYHNGADSYYSSRGFRSILEI